jgi:flagellar biosynthesis anti-sigma factor FlgM
MKVNKNSVSSTSYSPVKSTYGKSQPVSSPQPAGRGDSVEMSAAGALFQTARQLIDQVPDIRTESVTGIQQEFADGSYHRDEHEVANKVIEDHLSSS